MSEKIRCFIRKVIFRNSQNHFTVLAASCEKYNNFTASGYIDEIQEENELILEGEWTRHPKYGEQFSFKKYELVFSDNQAIVDFIVKLKLPSIGRSTAERIVEKFGKNALEILDNEIEKLKEIKKFGDKVFEEIKSIWREKSNIRKLYFFLLELGLQHSLAIKIYSVYGENSIWIIKNNPYVLVQDIIGIGFKTADKIALGLGFPEDSPLRIKALISHLINKSSNSGNVFLWEFETYEKIQEYLKLDKSELEIYLSEMEATKEVIYEREIISENCKGLGSPIYLRSFYIAEKKIAEAIVKKIKFEKVKSKYFNLQKKLSDEKLEETLKELQIDFNINFNDDQIEAIELSAKTNLFLLTGGPGTGKTTVVKALVELFLRQNKKIALCAPTGRAAKVLSESANYTAQTIHRLLEYDPIQSSFLKNEDSKLDLDVIIVDEFSMVDIFLFSSLLDAINDKTKLILIGDHYQLPSVGPGNLLKDLLTIESIPKIELKTIYRQTQESGIVLNAHRVKNGKDLSFNPELGDFVFIEAKESEESLNFLLDLISKDLPEKYGLDPMRDIQVISPMKKGTFGVGNLNILLRERLNKNYKYQKSKTKILGFIIGDKIMQIKNDYHKNVFNGDIGFVENIDYENEKLFAMFDDFYIEYSFSELENIQLSYASTVHKAQGSEYPIVVLTMFWSHFPLLQRNLLYTAITRGKKGVYIIGDKRAILRAIENDKPSNRNSLLKERIMSLL